MDVLFLLDSPVLEDLQGMSDAGHTNDREVFD